MTARSLVPICVGDFVQFRFLLDHTNAICVSNGASLSSISRGKYRTAQEKVDRFLFSIEIRYRQTELSGQGPRTTLPEETRRRK